MVLRWYFVHDAVLVSFPIRVNMSDLHAQAVAEGRVQEMQVAGGTAQPIDDGAPADPPSQPVTPAIPTTATRAPGEGGAGQGTGAGSGADGPQPGAIGVSQRPDYTRAICSFHGVCWSQG